MRTTRVLGACLLGAEAELVTVEAHFEAIEQKRTEVVLSGLPDPVIRESRGRLVAALDSIGLGPGPGRLLLNLVPAGMKKSGEMLDLPMALAAAGATGNLDPRQLERTLFLGEVGIDGRLHATPGGLAAAERARRAGIRRMVAPEATACEAACLPGVEAVAAGALRDVVAWVTGGKGSARRVEGASGDDGEAGAPTGDGFHALDAVRGHAFGKHALCVAAAGGHDLLWIGPPGTGKSLLARALPSLHAPPSLAERIEITRVSSAAGRWPGGLARVRPFRAPHHTTSYAGLVGGGQPLGPGEITLAHRGTLFLDELPEFRREALEALRQPLESGAVELARAGRLLVLPARFQLVAAMNPCPCGYRGHPRIPCRCAPFAVERYRRRVSGPLLDRIDLRIELPAPELDELAPHAPEKDGASAALRGRVLRARERIGDRQGGRLNARLGTAELDRFVPVTPKIRAMLTAAVDQRGLSARAIQSLRRVARTLADLEGKKTVGPEHLAQALGLRAEVLP